jgi:surface antigen/peptidoglycan hydrolase CwlO-like protein
LLDKNSIFGLIFFNKVVFTTHLGGDIMRGLIGKTKMKKAKNIRSRLFNSALVVFAFILSVGVISPSLASADQFSQQIQSLQTQNSQTQQTVNSLQDQAATYQAQLQQLQAQIAGLQASINATQGQISTTQAQIQANQEKLTQEKQTLDDIIKTMYVGGNLSTLEMLASSKNLSDFATKEEYQNIVQQNIQSILAEINQTQATLKQQQIQLNVILASQQSQQNQLQTYDAQQSQLLSYNQAQQAQYNQQIQANSSKIAALQAEQIAANRKLVGTGQIDATGSCGGSYPASATGPYGNWGCNYGLDNTIDNWGMYNRECVSYTAWMVYKTYGYMPYWGGNGNANEWPADAQAAGVPTGSTPKVNSVAIYMGGSSDPYGHAMWVRSVNGDGTITVDQYNLYYDGNYYETTIPSSGLVYIYFGG